MRTKITYNGNSIAYTDGSKIQINTAGHKMLGDILIEIDAPSEEIPEWDGSYTIGEVE